MVRVVIRTMTDGSWEIYTDEPLEVFSVDENTKDDRVYRLSYDQGALFLGGIDDLLGSDTPGHIGDGSAAECRAVNFVTGGPRVVFDNSQAAE